MRKLMILALVFSLSGGMVVGCGDTDTTTTATEDTTTTENTTATEDTTTTVYLKDIISTEGEAKVVFYLSVLTSSNLFSETSHLAWDIYKQIGSGMWDISDDIYDENGVCGNYTVEADNKTFVFNYNCTYEKGQITGTYETNGTAVTSISMNFSDGFSLGDDVQVEFSENASISAEFSVTNMTLTFKADKAEVVYTDFSGDVIDCLNSTGVVARYQDIDGNIYSNDDDVDNYTYKYDFTYEVEYPQFINEPVATSYEDYWDGTSSSYTKIADGAIVADNVVCTGEGDNETCTFDLTFNGGEIYSGTWDNFISELNSASDVCETIYP